jgi:hypothetical protein
MSTSRLLMLAVYPNGTSADIRPSRGETARLQPQMHHSRSPVVQSAFPTAPHRPDFTRAQRTRNEAPQDRQSSSRPRTRTSRFQCRKSGHALSVDWRDIAADHGIKAQTLTALTGHPTATPARLREIDVELAGPDGLTAHASTFDRRHVLQAWCNQLPADAPVTEVEQLARRTLADPAMVQLRGRQASVAMKRWDRRRMEAPNLGRPLLDRRAVRARTTAPLRLSSARDRKCRRGRPLGPRRSRPPQHPPQSRTETDGPRPHHLGTRVRCRHRPRRRGKDHRPRRRPRRLAGVRLRRRRLCRIGPRGTPTRARCRDPLLRDRGTSPRARNPFTRAQSSSLTKPAWPAPAPRTTPRRR